jgi:hypothetical protein
MRRLILCLLLLLAAPATAPLHARQVDNNRVAAVESRVSELEAGVKDAASTGLVLFFIGSFCALWAQNTRRNAWAWFFFGAVLNFIALLVLLYKNAEDNNDDPVPLKFQV